jgi:hypothetical protein
MSGDPELDPFAALRAAMNSTSTPLTRPAPATPDPKQPPEPPSPPPGRIPAGPMSTTPPAGDLIRLALRRIRR